jgi:hypothetical protein
MSATSPPAAARRERLFRWALVALILLLPAVYVPRLFFGQRAEAPSLPTPQWVHCVIVSAARVEPGTFEHPGPRLERLLRRGSLVRNLWAPSADASAAAASLWCGRWPRQIGALAPQPRLPETTWTLAAAARAAGTATCAIGAPIEVPGFTERSAVGTDPASAGNAAADFARAPPGARLLCWVHLEWADAAAFEAVLAPLQAALAADDRRYDTLTMLTGFAQGPRDGPATALACPLATELPAALYSGRTSEALLSHVDIAGMLAKVMQLDLPVAQRGQLPLVSREKSLWAALRGSRADEAVLIQNRESEELLLSAPGAPLSQLTRVRASLPLLGPESVEAWLPGPNGPQRAEGASLTALAKKFLDYAGAAR